MVHAVGKHVGNIARVGVYKRWGSIFKVAPYIALRGISYKVNEQGQILITNVPQREKEILQFLDLTKPCPEVAGMSKLRELYQNEINGTGGAACPPCQLNSIQRKYRFLLNKDIYNIPQDA